MKYSDMFPGKPEFTLKSRPKRVYKLRLPNLDDRDWMIQNFKIDDPEIAKKLFNPPQWKVITRIVYRLLEDKSDLLAQTVTLIDDDGNKQEGVKVTGPELLLKLIHGQEEALTVLSAMNSAIALSEPLVAEYMKAELGAEKKRINRQKKSIGQRSSTSSALSTDGVIGESVPSQ